MPLGDPLLDRRTPAIMPAMRGNRPGLPFRVACLALISVLACLPASARQVAPCYYPTIEYFVADGDLVVRGVVTKGPVVLTLPVASWDIRNLRSGDTPPPQTRFQKLSVRVEETLRRDPAVATVDPKGQTLEFLVEEFEAASPGHRWDGREMLLSLRSTSRWRPYEAVTQELCPWIVRMDAGSDNNSGMRNFFWWAYDLSSDDVTAYDLSATRVRRGADVLAKARQAAAFALPPVADDELHQTVPGMSRPFVELLPLDRTDHYLYAPIDSRLEAPARLWVSQFRRSDEIAWNAKEAISAIRSPHESQTVELFKKLATTSEPAVEGWVGEDRWETPVYDLRWWARRVLHRWQTPPGEWSEAFEYRMPLRRVGAGNAWPLLAPIGIFLAVWGWRRWRGRPVGLVSAALTTVMLVAGFAWVRSHWKVDELWYGGAAERRELVSVNGQLQLLTIRHWDEPFPLMIGSADRTGDIDRSLSWETIERIAAEGSSTAGVRQATGDTPDWATRGKLPEYVPARKSPPRSGSDDWPDARGDEDDDQPFGGASPTGGGLFSPTLRAIRAYPFTFVSVPWLYVVAVGALGPMSWWLAAVRAKRRRFKGLCGRCGYDLRATPTDQPCPECGTLRRGYAVKRAN